ncbi:MAG: biotin carboxylase [Thaumarchaeota archaeon]|nr:MAG: biotin carboxylase [Nitrososphaerota archaeon]
MFSKVLIANRGEIAARVIRTCRRLGVETVAIYSDADAGAPHTKLADESMRVGESPPLKSYLSIANICEAVTRTGAEAVHPGYGFLSEFYQFAEAVEKAGAVWVGPSPRVMRKIESKTYSRRVARENGIPTIPGTYEPVGDPAELEKLLSEFGPILIKPDAGGGGKGTRKVTEPRAAKEALEGASREAKLYFGNGDVYAEKLLDAPRHVEVQILADEGGVIHLFERECSLQRRFQKVVEESPSPALTREQRADLLRAAKAMATATGYTNAGTFEFLYEESKEQFYFLEINKRLQVEHPVTEMTTGVDIVEQQLRVASGEGLGIEQDGVEQRGNSIEARVYAEDPRTFMPSPGKITKLRIPTGEHIRVDHALEVGTSVSFYYDPLIAKLIAWGSSRREAISRVLESLSDFVIEGVKTSIPLQRVILRSKDFLDGRFDTTYLDSKLTDLRAEIED